MEKEILRILQNLDPRIRQKIVDLHDMADAAGGAAHRAHDAVMDVQRQLQNGRLRYEAEQRKHENRAARLLQRSNPSAQAEGKQLEQHLAAIHAENELLHGELMRLRSQHRRAQENFNSLGNCAARIREFLMRGSPSNAILVDPPAVKLRRGESFGDAVDAVREEISNLKAEMHHVRTAPVTVDEALQRVRAWFEKLQDAAMPDVEAFYTPSGDMPVGWATRRFPVLDAFGTDTNKHVLATDPVALMALCFPGEFWSTLEQQIRSSGDDTDAQVPLGDRRAMLLDLAERLEDAERREERLIELAAEDHQVIPRRPDARPEIILGIQLPPHHWNIDKAA